MPRPPQIAIIGAGIIGAAIAYHLAKSGAAPLLIDAGAGGGEATAASWAWLNASWGNPPEYAMLRRRSLALWRELGKELPELPLRFCGSLTYDLSEADLQRFVSEFHSDDYPVRMIGREEITRLEPKLTQPPSSAAHCPAEGVVEPSVASAVLRARALALGGTFRPSTRIERLLIESGRIAGFVSAGERTDIDVAVVCAGNGTSQLLASAGFSLPMTAPEGLLVHTQPLASVLNGLIIAPDLHVRQTVEGRLVAGFDFVGSVVDEPAKAALRLVESMNLRLRLPEPVQLAFTTVGLRPTPADGFPVIGFVPNIDGLYVAAMHSGMTLAAAAGKFAAAEIAGGAAEPLLTHYRPNRLTSR